MALEPGGTGYSASPTSSGRASPAPRNQHIGQRDDLRPRDKAFRRYATGVERALALFETAFEDWADYISFLGRLLKSLQAHPDNCTIVPSKNLVAKRLSQCLNPELPSGVHQKVLEVYAFIFTLIGRDTLSRELSLYLPGLAPTLSFASLTVRSLFLSLLEAHCLQLESYALRPALKSLILMLLPGLEEETSEDFERTLRVLNAFKVGIHGDHDTTNEYVQGDQYFWQCFFLATITSKSRRLGALAYMIKCLPKLGGAHIKTSVNTTAVADISHDATMVTSPEPGLLVRCFAAGLNDDQLLIQRGFLDLLVTHLPLHAKVLQTRVKQADLELLMISASGVVARRDMSLNRRLWSWLLGPEPAGGSDNHGADSPTHTATDFTADGVTTRTKYFEEFGLQPLRRALLAMLDKHYSTSTERARPYRICLSLMDRWEIGGLIVPEIFMPVINSVRRYESSSANKDEFSEVLRSASVFFDGVESGLIWGEILDLSSEALMQHEASLDQSIEKLRVVQFILTHFNVREEEMLVIHAPRVALALILMLKTSPAVPSEETSHSRGTPREITQLAIHIVNDLVDLIPERAYYHTSRPSRNTENEIAQLDKVDTYQQLRKFYVQDQGNLDIADAPLNADELCRLTLTEAGRLVIEEMKDVSSSAEGTSKIRMLINFLAKTTKPSGFSVHEIISTVKSTLKSKVRPSFAKFSSAIALVISCFEGTYIDLQELSSLVEVLVETAWHYLSPSYPKYHVETAKMLWQLQTVLTLDNHELEAALSCQIIKSNSSDDISGSASDVCQKFAILWTHFVVDNAGNLERRSSKSLMPSAKSGLGMYEIILGRPTFLLLDALLDERTQLYVAVKTWIQGLSGLDRFFHLFVAKFAVFEFLRSPLGSEESHNATSIEAEEEHDLDQCLYYLQTLSNVLKLSSTRTWTSLAQNSVSTEKVYIDLFRITSHDGELSLLKFFTHVAMCAIAYSSQDTRISMSVTQLQRIALIVLNQLLESPVASSLCALHLEHKLIELLHTSVEKCTDNLLQISLLDAVHRALRLNTINTEGPPPSPTSARRISLQSLANASKISLKLDNQSSFLPPPPPSLVKCLQAGFSSRNCRPVLDSWISFLAEVLPLYSESIFQVLIPLINTLCTEVSRAFGILQRTFTTTSVEVDSLPESTLIFLINGLEQVLARGHERLIKDESQSSQAKSPDQPQGFFGNMVSGVFASDSPATRSQNANNRLTVILSFQDAIRISFSIWSWGAIGFEDGMQDPASVASFQYTSLRMRNRARRLLEHLFAAEALECLETVVEIWQKDRITDFLKATNAFNLLHVLNGSRPQYTLPAIFDAIYSRTNPAVLEFSRRSTLTTDLRDTDIVVFLVEYARSLEDDAMDEIWQDCLTFLKDILANPFPHRQILPNLLEFVSILGEKVDNTNFGEQKKMRRELGDLFLRLLTATFTTSPISFSNNPGSSALSVAGEKQTDVDDRAHGKAGDIVAILAAITPGLVMVLVEPDRILSAATTISAGVISPTIRSKSFPENVTRSTLDLLYHIARLPGTQKSWKKDLSDALNDSRFFTSSVGIVESNWLPLLKQWTLSDKERMPELLSRLTPPTTAGIVFGVGATSARLEADRKTQLNLRRVATLILASATDHFVTELVPLEGKLVELLAATSTSSPSSNTRAEIFMVLHALALKISPIHLAPLWPVINAELHTSINSVVATDHSVKAEMYTHHSILQACKLLDVLLCISPDDFQLHEWLYVTDTIDAVYPSTNHRPVGLIDELAEELGSDMNVSLNYAENMTLNSNIDKTLRRPLLGVGGMEYSNVNIEKREEFVGAVLRPFFSQLSIFAFERTYELGGIDWETCTKALLTDLFNETGIVKAL